MVGPQHHIELELHRLSIGALSAYTVYLLRAMGYKCKASQDLKPAEAIFNIRVVEKDMKE